MGTGYTRNDTSNNIADGNVINASDLDGEFDAVQAAFNGTTGHSHDGTSGEGPQIAAGGIASNAVTTAKILDGNVTTAKIANANVTLAKMAANSIDSDQYVDGSIDTAHIANDAVTGDKLANNIQIAGTLGVTGQTTLTTHLNMGDNDTIKLGDSADLQIYHDGLNSYILDGGTGSLFIRGTNLFLQAYNGDTYIDSAENGAVNLRYDNSVKLATKSDGVDITGELQSDSLDVDGNADISGNLTMSGGGNIDLADAAQVRLGASQDLQIYHDGSNSWVKDVGAGDLILQGTELRIRAGNNENHIYCAQDGAVQVYHNGSVKLATTSTGVSVTGNVVVSGTVDGRDVASDGSKLDGIESGATADQTANEILTLIKTVDGAGSGLDADTLDGLTSGSFLRSDAGDTASQRLTFSANDTNNWDTIATASGSQGAFEVFNNGVNNDAFISFHVGSDFACYFGLDGGINDIAVGGWSFGAASYRIWHQGNDGSGSGLDADTVDGVQASSFLRSDAEDTKTAGALNFSDNVRARFGASNDLQIYHDGSNSYVNDTGTGALILQGGTQTKIQASNGENGLIVNDNGAVWLYYDNSQKLSTVSDGISVTGNVFGSNGLFGLDATDYTQFINNSHIRFVINNSEEFRMEADGDFHADANVIAHSTTVSDERLKENIEKIENATDKVSQLNGYTFNYKKDGRKGAGVIAQEVEKVLPSAVMEKQLPLKHDDGIAYKIVEYDQIIGLLIESIKELKQEINTLKGE